MLPPTTTILQYKGRTMLNSHFPKLITVSGLRDAKMQVLTAFRGPQDVHETMRRSKEHACLETGAGVICVSCEALLPGLARRAQRFQTQLQLLTGAKVFIYHVVADPLTSLATSDTQATQHQSPVFPPEGLKRLSQVTTSLTFQIYETFRGCHTST